VSVYVSKDGQTDRNMPLDNEVPRRNPKNKQVRLQNNLCVWVYVLNIL